MSCSDILLTVLPYNLKIASFERDKCVKELLSSFLRLFFFTSQSGRFFSYAETVNEVSLVADLDSLSLFPSESYQAAEETWCAVQISEGAAGFDQVAIIQRITEPLALDSISVLFISTFQTDYVLVRHEDLADAIRCLQARFTVEVDAQGAILEEVESIDDTRLSCKESLALHQHVLTVPNISFKLVSIPKGAEQDHMYALVKLFFCNDKENSFASFTETDDEICVLTADAEFIAYAERQGSLMLSPHAWKIVQVGSSNLGFTETGIVAGQTSILSGAGSTVIYLSTYSTDFTLVPQSDWENAAMALRRHFQVVERDFIRFSTCEAEPLLALAEPQQEPC